MEKAAPANPICIWIGYQITWNSQWIHFDDKNERLNDSWLQKHVKLACLLCIHLFIFGVDFNIDLLFSEEEKNQPKNRCAKNSERYFQKFLLFSTASDVGKSEWLMDADGQTALSYLSFPTSRIKLSSHCGSADCHPAQILLNFASLRGICFNLLTFSVTTFISVGSTEKKEINILSAGCFQPRRKS